MAFCRNCGAQMGEGENFCPKCGQSTGAPVNRGSAPAGAPVRANAGGDLFSNLLSYIKDFFSKDPTRGAHRALSSRSFEGTVFLGLFFLVFAFAIPLFFHESYGSALRVREYSYISDRIKEAMPFGSLFGLSVAVGSIILIVITGTAILHIRVIQRKNVNIVSILNLVGYSMIPVIIALLANMVFGLITPYIPLIILAVAGFMQVFILVKGINSLDETGNSNMMMHSILFAMAFATIIFFSSLIFSHFLEYPMSGFLWKISY